MDEIHKSGAETQFSLAALELTGLRPKTHAAQEDGPSVQPPALTFELPLNGVQPLPAMGAALAFTAGLLWAVVRLWVFER